MNEDAHLESAYEDRFLDAYAYEELGATFGEAFGRTDDGYEDPADYA